MRQEPSLLSGVAINELYTSAIPLVTTSATGDRVNLQRAGLQVMGLNYLGPCGLGSISLSVHTYSQILKDLESRPAPAHLPRPHPHPLIHTSDFSPPQDTGSEKALWVSWPNLSFQAFALPSPNTSWATPVSSANGQVPGRACVPSLSNGYTQWPEGHGLVWGPCVRTGLGLSILWHAGSPGRW